MFPSIQLQDQTSLVWHSPGYAFSLLAFLLCASDHELAAKTACGGTPTLFSSLMILPGLHKQQSSGPDLAKGEYPACAAMTSGYVFRVENQATVFYLQQTGRSGHLTTVEVQSPGAGGSDANCFWRARRGWDAALLSALAGLATIVTGFYLASMDDLAAAGVLGLFVTVRLINVVILRNRAAPGWFGAPEPGVKGDLLILLSQDRWVRMQGLVDDLKAVNSGTWLREQSLFERLASTFATGLLCLAGAVATHITSTGALSLTMLLAGTIILVTLARHRTESMTMHGRVLHVLERKKYTRRLILAEELIRETGREDWAVRLGIVQPKDKSGEHEKIM